MKRLIDLFLNTWFLSFWVTLIILLFNPVRIDKYESAVIERGEYLNDHMVHYVDLDHDGNTEVISVFHNGLGIAALTVSNMHGVLDQWTFKGRYDFATNTGIVITGDYDNNGINEIYTFTVSSDSILLHIIPDFRMKDPLIRNKFVARTGKRNNKADPYIVEAQMDDTDKDGMSELIFGIGTGYSLYPRRIYAYNIVEDRFYTSPKYGYFINRIIQEDINNDGLKEIIPWGYAADNFHDSLVPFHDTCSWLMAFDHNLSFVFDPVGFPGVFSDLRVAVATNEKRNQILVALYCPPENTGSSNQLLSFDSKGEIIKSIPLKSTTFEISTLTDNEGNKQILLGTEGEGISMLDHTFKNTANLSFDYDGYIMCMDMDLDGFQEIVNIDLTGRKLIVFRNTLDHPVEINIAGHDEKGILCSVKKKSGQSQGIYVQMGSNYGLYSYGINKVYHYRWLLYACIYGGVLSFSLIVRKVQREQIRRKNAKNKQITDLQLQIVRNQLDPHFIMNAINSIIASLNDSNKDELKRQLMHFSLLHRSLVLTSDQIKRSLQEEIEFTKTYLALEKFRFGDKFDFTFEIGSSVNLETGVPKMILQIHVENALKHGIFHLQKPGLLEIKISGNEDRLIMEISDNGVGRRFTRNLDDGSTGKGTLLMEQYTKLLNKTFSDKVLIKTEDLYDRSGEAAGTRVLVTVSTI